MNRRNFIPSDFAYWIQGAIEIGLLTGFDEEQINKIKRRINDVKAKDQFVQTIWLLLNICPPEAAFKKINELLFAKFVHEIDPSYDGDQDYLLKVHAGLAE